MRARLLPGLLAPRCAAACLPPSTRARLAPRQAGVPAPARAHADFVAILREHAPAWRGVAHCFTGSAEELSCYLELGLAIGITGWICDERRGSHLAAL